MIDINLYPAELRKKKRRTPKFLSDGFSIPKEVMVGLIGGLITLLVATSIFVQTVIFSKYSQHKELQQEWETLLPTKRSVDVVTNKLRSIQGKIRSIKSIVGDKEIFWSQKLNEISNHVPRGVWIKRVAFGENALFIKGSAVSKGKDEMISVHRFASNLKSQENFSKDLIDLEVGSIQRRSIKDVDIADFSIKAKIK